MHKSITRVVVAGAAVAALSALGVSGAGASGAATRAGRSVGHPAVTASTTAAVPGAQLWVNRYNGPDNSSDTNALVAVSGDRVFVTGTSQGRTSLGDYATVAYSG